MATHPVSGTGAVGDATTTQPLWRDRNTEGGLWWKVTLVVLGLVTPILAFKGALDPFPTFPNDRGVFIAIACIVIAAVW